MKKLYKSDVDRKLCGVCGGIAEYLGIDSTIVRLIWVVLVVFSEREFWHTSLPHLLFPIIRIK